MFRRILISSSTNISLESARIGVVTSLPVALSVFAYGLVYGLLTKEAGLNLMEAALSSGVIFAGSAQFVALDMWIHPLPVSALIFTTFVVNLRHVLMSASLTPWLRKAVPQVRYPLLFFLVDESWALTYSALVRGKVDLGFLLGSGVLLWITWVSATLSGRTVGAVISDPAQFGLDFAFTAVFLVLLFGLWKGKEDIPAWAIAATTALVVHYFIPGKWYIVIGGLTGSMTGLWRSNALR
ncbi:MAG: AzlC family ABC transporter permease [Desulfofustis sp. PB-SRB1]|jgi:4-azaleucine resistance transporter AzlC|nr:AzlC family ABC transporter permease [Desulfofustis sp. PB-SRB1]MBM1003208.1 AzlC family ABC transporter permease [Desulfofustis sp. PB-SRB1]